MTAQTLTRPELNPTRSEIFHWFNKALAAAHAGKLPEKKVRAALGYLLRTEINIYETTTETCSCPDHKFSAGACKHMIAAMIMTRIAENRNGKVVEEKAQTEKLSGRNFVVHIENEISLARQWTRREYHEFLFATWDQVHSFKKQYPGIVLVPTAEAKGKKVYCEDHRADIAEGIQFTRYN